MAEGLVAVSRSILKWMAEVGYSIENKSKLDEAELAYTENGGIQRSNC